MNIEPLSLSLFGPFEARYNDQLITSFSTDKVRALLAYLAVESGLPHRRETLASLFWPNYTDEAALRNLRQSIYRLRQTLQKTDPALPDRVITQNRLTVTLNTDAISLDISRVSRLFKLAQQPDDQVSNLEQMVSTYRGEILEGFSINGAYAFEEWITIQREIHRQKISKAFIQLVTIYESSQDYQKILTIAPKLLALDPWHEETHRQIMRAHARLGNRNQAIAHYHKLNKALVNELGIDPSPATIALFKEIEHINKGNSSSTPKGLPKSKTSSPNKKRVRKIPAIISPIVGRQNEIEHLTQTLPSPTCRLLTVTGPGGIGKTRLCIETAHRLIETENVFQDGIIFISLDKIERETLLIPTIAESLGISLRSRTDQQKELFEQISEKNILLILDNFEHLLTQNKQGDLPFATSFILEFLSATSHSTLVITSRNSLGIQPEWIFPLEGLSYKPTDGDQNNDPLHLPAPQLFIQNAKRFSLSLDPNDHTKSILEICRLTDGLPLAIEMAATWLRIYSCEEIAESIAKSLDFLTTSFHDTPPRHYSIRVILNSTWEQLTHEQKSTLTALSVFRGGFTIQAALQVAQANILNLSILLERSILRRTNDKRYFLHELVRQFADEKLTTSSEEYPTKERHANFYFTNLKHNIIQFSGPNPVEAINQIRQEMENLRKAWDWAALQKKLPLLEMGMKGLTQIWIFTGTYIEGETNIQKALTATKDIPEDASVAAIRSYLLSALAWLQMGTGKNDEANKNLLAAITLAETWNNPEMRANALSHYGWLLQQKGQLDQSETVLEEACAIFDKNQNLLQLSLALIRRGGIYWWRNQIEKSLEYYEKSLEIEKKLENKRGINRAYGGLGMAYIDLEKFEEASIYLEKSLELDRELGNRLGTVRNLGHLGNIYMRKGNYDLAIARYQEALEIEQSIGGRNTSSVWLTNLGKVFLEAKNYKTANEYFDEAIQFAQDIGRQHQLCEALLGKADILLRQRRLEESRSLIDESLKISYEIDRKDTKLQGVILKARWLTQTGEQKKARQLLESSRATLASEYKETETNARFFYELWKIDQRIEDAQEALLLYQDCLSRSEQIEYTECITELSGFLDGKL